MYNTPQRGNHQTYRIYSYEVEKGCHFLVFDMCYIFIFHLKKKLVYMAYTTTFI